MASAFALLGVLLYAALVPGHVISQAAAFLLADELGTALEMSCHEGVAMEGTSAPGEPLAPQKKCPFCKGYAPFMTALAGISDAGTIDAERTTLQFVVADDQAVQRMSRRPHNRGPPLEL